VNTAIEVPTHEEIERGAHINLSALLMSEEYLQMAKMQYYFEHKNEIDPELEEAKKYLSCRECGKCGCDCEVKEEVE
jgi:predicted aldo/keto reductase-like oxidoreductase